MNLDEFAFFNQQLAAMLHSGIPLEGALEQLSAAMHRGGLRQSLQQLEAKLRQGVPLTEALADSRLPGFYVQMINVGVAANDLPGVLALVADYYQKVNTVWTRLSCSDCWRWGWPLRALHRRSGNTRGGGYRLSARRVCGNWRQD